MMPIAKTLLLIWALCSGQGDFSTFKDGLETKFETYHQDNEDGDWNKYLNREVLIKVTALKKDDKSIKELMFYVAMYKEKDCELPESIKPYVQRLGDGMCSCLIGEVKDQIKER
jgi:hypothetical protein